MNEWTVIVDYIQLRQSIQVEARVKWADFSAPYTVGKMYEHRIWLKLKHLLCYILSRF